MTSVSGDGKRWLPRQAINGAQLLVGVLAAAVSIVIGTGSVVVGAMTVEPASLVRDIGTFGVVVPGEEYSSDFEVCIQGGDPIDYVITLVQADSLPDMTPFLDVIRDPAETDVVPDNLADATVGTGDDECDKWLVTFTAPHCRGAYNPGTDPQGNGATIACQVEKPSPDPQTWSEGALTGAQLRIDPRGAVAEESRAPVALPATGGEPPINR